MTDEQYMKLAIEMAKTTEGQTSPNPVVGAVLVHNNQVVGMGAHLKAGELHAERHALQMAGDKAEGATMYVTLEPCSHHGKTPPCADALIEAKVSKVVVATKDPNPQVAGKGIKKLTSAGITVVEGVLKHEADQLNRTFFHAIQTKKPFVTLKSATSLDGKIATSKGESKWITGDEARADVHYLRHIHDGILVGVNTVLKDDPSLTTRMSGGGSHPVRIVLDHHLKTPLNAKLVTDGIAPTWIIASEASDSNKRDALEKLGVKVFTVGKEHIEIIELLYFLGEKKLNSLLVEGGGVINDSFLRSGEFDQVIVYLAPILIGGKEAYSSFSGLGIENLSNAVKLRIVEVTQTGSDIKITAEKESV